MHNILSSIIKIFIIGCCCLGSIHAYSQDSKALEKKRKNLQNEINIINKSLSKTLQSKKHSYKALSILKTQIKAREKLITTINEEINLLQQDIKRKIIENNSLQQQLKLMKQSYVQTIRQAQYNKHVLSKLVFIFSAKDFNQAYKRLQYFSQLASYRRVKADAIADKSKKINSNVSKIEKIIKNKNYLLGSKTKEKKKLDLNWKQQNKIVKQLQSQESQLRKKLENKQKEQVSLNRAIQLAIKKELALAKSKKSNAAINNTKSLLTYTPEARKLSVKFLENKGKLPWPVAFGQIIEQFGTHPHPSLKKVKTNNIGVNIQTVSGAPIRSVFNGFVIAVQLLYGRYAIIIQHGEYFTTYANLASVNVKRGDKVNTKQIIGKAPIDQGGLSDIQFIITQGTNNVNPEIWLASK